MNKFLEERLELANYGWGSDGTDFWSIDFSHDFFYIFYKNKKFYIDYTFNYDISEKTIEYIIRDLEAHGFKQKTLERERDYISWRE